MCLNFFLPHRNIELGTVETIEVAMCKILCTYVFKFSYHIET